MSAPPMTRCGCGDVALNGFDSCRACVARDRRGRPLRLEDETPEDFDVYDPDADDVIYADGPRADRLRQLHRIGGAL